MVQPSAPPRSRRSLPPLWVLVGRVVALEDARDRPARAAVAAQAVVDLDALARDLGDDPQLDALAEECFDGDPSSCDDLYRDSDVGSDYEEYGGTCGGRTGSGQLGGCHERYPDPDFAELRRECGGGDDAACDELYLLSPDRSLDEEYGSTCGGRSEDELAGACAGP